MCLWKLYFELFLKRGRVLFKVFVGLRALIQLGLKFLTRGLQHENRESTCMDKNLDTRRFIL